MTVVTVTTGKDLVKCPNTLRAAHPHSCVHPEQLGYPLRWLLIFKFMASFQRPQGLTTALHFLPHSLKLCASVFASVTCAL